MQDNGHPECRLRFQNPVASSYKVTEGKVGIEKRCLINDVIQTLAYLRERGIRFGKAISCGNEADPGITDALAYLGSDEQTKAIILTAKGSGTAGGSWKRPGGSRRQSRSSPSM